MKQKFWIPWVGLATLLLLSPTPARSGDIGDVVITLERTRCFGTCPVYRLTIYGDGKVVYQGEDFVKVKGTQTAHMVREKVEGLVNEFDKVRFFSLQDRYTGSVTDLPTTITSITIHGKTKTVRNYFGAPKELIALEEKIDETTHSKQWVGD